LTGQGSVYTEFIASELKREYERRDRIDTRAAATVTGAAGLITISLAALAVIKGKDFVVHGAALVSLFIALLFFVASATLATAAAINWPYLVAKPDTLKTMLSASHWTDTEVTAMNSTAQLNCRTLNSLRRGNDRKSDLFLAALAGQVLAIAGLAVTVFLIVD
jgi:hypothetical protein